MNCPMRRESRNSRCVRGRSESPKPLLIRTNLDSYTTVCITQAATRVGAEQARQIEDEKATAGHQQDTIHQVTVVPPRDIPETRGTSAHVSSVEATGKASDNAVVLSIPVPQNYDQ